MRVVVTGASGQVGTDIVAALAGHDVLAAPRSELDVSDHHACMQRIAPAAPEVVIHAAAYTDVDGCESDPERAWAVNVIGSQNVALAARHAGAFLVTISS